MLEAAFAVAWTPVLYVGRAPADVKPLTSSQLHRRSEGG
jgi:hypothetical protein